MIEASDSSFWQQLWCESMNSPADVFEVMPGAEVRALREESPVNLSTLVYKGVEELVRSTDTLVNTMDQQRVVLNACRILTRLLPYLFEDPDWRMFFWTNLPLPAESGTSSKARDADGETDSEAEERSKHPSTEKKEEKGVPLAHSLLTAVSSLLFCPDFTVPSLPCRRSRFSSPPDSPPEHLQNIDSCQYIWQSGIGFTSPDRPTTVYDSNRTELLTLLLTCFSSSMYLTPKEAASHTDEARNKWIEFFTSDENRHALPLFTSLLNTVISYEPNGILPFNHLLFSDPREKLVEVCT